MKIVESKSSYKITMSKSEWTSMGDTRGWFKKEAMPVPITEDIRSKMAKDGIYAVLNMTDVKEPMPKADKGAIDKILADEGIVELFNEISPVTVLQLPKILVPNMDNLVDIDGNTYYLAHVVEPKDPKRADKARGLEKGVHYDGKIVCLDVSSGEPVEFSYDQYADKIKTSPRSREVTMEKVNAEISEWNRRLDKIENALGPTKLALQLMWVEDKVQERLDTLNGQLDSIKQKKEDPLASSEGYKEWIDFLRAGVKAGSFNLRDTFDTLLFLYKLQPQELVTQLESGSAEIAVPEEIKSALLAIGYQEISAAEEDRQKVKKDWEAREERMEAPLEHGKMPKPEPIREYTLEEIPGSEYKKPKQYQALQSWVQSLYRQQESITRDIKELEGIKGTFSDVRMFIGSLERGERAIEYLRNEGSPIMDRLKVFLDESQKFLKRYVNNVVEDGAINRGLLGRSGQLGNALIGIALNRIYNVIQETIIEIEGVEVTGREDENKLGPEIEAKVKSKIERMSELLWIPFEDRMCLK